MFKATVLLIIAQVAISIATEIATDQQQHKFITSSNEKVITKITQKQQ